MMVETISKKELKILVFWAHVGTLYSHGGSDADKIPKIIIKYMKKLKLHPADFCCFDYGDRGEVAKSISNLWKRLEKNG